MKTTLMLKMRFSLYFSLVLLAISASQPVDAAAAVMPQLDRLSPLSDNVSSPTDVALDQQGRIYIAETSKNRITILSQSGRFTGKRLTEVADPVSVAVDAAGRILVGNARNGSVAVFGPDLELLFNLGIGDGEFGNPTDIAIDDTGTIYVVDNSNNSISTYNATGEYTGSIGTPGNEKGQLHHPISITIDANAGEIIVLDHQQVLDNASGKMVGGARIQYFDMDGTVQRAFSKFGYNNAGIIIDPATGRNKSNYDITMGQLTRPNQITVDDKSRIYVTDARMQNVMLYDNNDNFLGAIDSVTSPLRIPLGITFGRSGCLYVTSLLTGKVEVFGIDDFTALFTTPPALEFKVTENSNAPYSKAATIRNVGKAAMNWTAFAPDPWVSLGTTAGTLAAAETSLLDITVNPNGLAVGEYTGSVAVDSGVGATEAIKVILKVEPNPLRIAPGALSFETTVGTTPSGRQLSINSSLESSMRWDASTDQQWITLSKTTGMTPETVRVYTDIASLAPGVHNGIITFVPQGDTPVPVTIPVSLILTDSTTPVENAPGATDEGKNKWNKKWMISQLLPGTSLNGVSGTSDSDAFAVGEQGTILHFDGKDWTRMNSGTTNTLNSVWGSSPSNVLAVGTQGLVLNYNGTDWSRNTTAGGRGLQDIWGNSDMHIFTAGALGSILDNSFTSTIELGVALRSIWGSSENDVFAAGEAGAIFHYDGSSWKPMAANSSEWLNGIWGSLPSDLFVVGENGAIVHFDGTNWAAMESGTTLTLNGICGFSADDIYVVGDNSLILHYNGSEWGAMDAGAKVDLNDIWCIGKGDIFAVGDDGIIIHGKAIQFPWKTIIQQIVINSATTKEEKEKEAKNK